MKGKEGRALGLGVSDLKPSQIGLGAAHVVIGSQVRAREYAERPHACLEMRLLAAPQRKHSGSSSSASTAGWERAMRAATWTSF